MEKVATATGYHVALAGSILHKGKSNHDLDVIVFPHCKPKATEETLDAFRAGLQKQLGLVQLVTVDQVHRYWRRHGSEDTKHVEVWLTNHAKSRRIDLIIMS